MFSKNISTLWLRLIPMFLVCFLITSTALAQEARPRLGLKLSSAELPSLLLQHLKLAPGEGLMIDNIAVGGELEATGLSKGDILLSIDSKPVTSVSELNAYLKTCAPQARVSLEVIQKGEQRQIFVTLDKLPDTITWKHIDRLQAIDQHNFHPMQPPRPLSANRQSFESSHRMVFRSQIAAPDGIKQISVTIEGDPKDVDTHIEIEIDNRSYQSTVGDLNALPEEPRIAAQNALRQAGDFSSSFGTGQLPIDEIMQRHRREMDNFQKLFQQLMLQSPMLAPQSAPPIQIIPQTKTTPIQS